MKIGHWIGIGFVVMVVLTLAVVFAGDKDKTQSTNNVTEQKNTYNLPDYPTKTATIQGEKFTILTTRTSQESQLGLGAVEKLPSHYGMSFNAYGRMGIWMKGMNYPIDIIWLDKNGAVVHIVHDAQPSSYPKTTFYNPVETNARMVIELNSGEAKRLGLENGVKITLE